MLLDTYSQAHVRSILNGLGIKILGETFNDFLCLCPFHGNRNTPSFSVSHTKGVYLCFNPSCDAAGTIADLVKEISHRNDFEAMRFIQSCKVGTAADFEDELATLLEDKPEWVEFSQEKLDEMYYETRGLAGFRPTEYFESRGISRESIDYFRLGYSYKQDMVIVPVHNPDGLPVGIVGRSIEGKSFKNSRNLPRSKTMFNLHRAKKASAIVIVCESSFDAIRIHQAGFPNVVATLGGFLSRENLNNLNRYFSKIIIMTDNDVPAVAENCRKCYPDKCSGHSPGRDLGMSIANGLSNKDINWAVWGFGEIYPHHAKDVGDLEDSEIKKCILGAISHLEYTSQFVL